MVNFPLVYKIIGSLLFLLGTLLGICVGISAYYQEDDLLSFLIAAILTISMGFPRDLNMGYLLAFWHATLPHRRIHSQRDGRLL